MPTEKCCVSGCGKVATTSIGNSLLPGSIPFCKRCFYLYQIHCKAREDMFKTKGMEEMANKLYGTKEV